MFPTVTLSFTAREDAGFQNQYAARIFLNRKSLGRDSDRAYVQLDIAVGPLSEGTTLSS